MIDRKLYFLIDYFPLAKRKASIIPLSPKKINSTMKVLKAETDS